MSGMTVIVKTVATFISSAVMLFGAYLIFHGHLSPGGGFAGGVILASGFVLLTLAYGKKAALSKLSVSFASIFESLGALLFLGVALAGFLGGYFFLNILPEGEPFKLLSAGIIPLCNIGVGIKVGAALFLVFIALSALRIKMKRSS